MALFIIIAILMFGILIAVHEFGHFITAKLLGVRVNEFAIGMGPLVFSRKRGETQYSLRAIPIGGFCAMEGEDEDSKDPKSFSNKAAWKKLVILVAGSFMNLLTGVIIILFVGNMALPTVASFTEETPLRESALMVGDRFVRIDGHRVYTAEDAGFLLGRAGDFVDLVLERDGQEIVLNHFDMSRYGVERSDGTVSYQRGVTIGSAPDGSLLTRLKLTAGQSICYVRTVWLSVGDLLTGQVGIKEMSGPIGIVSMVGEIGEANAQKNGMGIAMLSVLSFISFIAINLAVMNLLPIPALDGGRIFFLAVNGVYTLFTRRKLDPKYEGYVNMAGLFCLLALMAVVAFNDIVRVVQKFL